jgi:hypothetical protein
MNITVKPSGMRRNVRLIVAAGLRPIIHGDPGIGKSEIMKQIADEQFAEIYGYRVFAGELQEKVVLKATKNAPATDHWQAVPYGFERPWFRDIRAALLDAVDLRGLPTVTPEGKVRWAVPEFLPIDPRGGIFFLDEINRGSTMVQNACFSLVQDGVLGEYRMPAAWIRAAAINDKDIGASKMMSALNARFGHLYLVPDVDESSQHAIDHNWHPMVVAWFRFRPTMLHAYNPQAVVSPNPRAWEYVSKILNADDGSLTQQDMLALIAGFVGEGAAGEFMSFMQLFKSLPNVDNIIADPLNAMVPTGDNVSISYAIAEALTRRMNAGNFGRIVQYLERLQLEYMVKGVLGGIRKNPELAHLPAYTKWTIKYSELTAA